MKKALMASVLSIFLGVGVLFSGCGSTDLSEINKQIADLQQQITESNQTIDDLQQQIAESNQTIQELQTRLNQAEANQQELLLDLTTAQGQLLELQEQVFGKVNNYYQINETLSYSVNGLKLLDFKPTSTDVRANYLIYYTTTSYEPNFDLLNISLNFSAYFYDKINNKTHQTFDINEERIAFSSSIPTGTSSGLIYLYLENKIWGIYELNFV